MSPAPASEGLRNDQLRAAVQAALAGKPAVLESLLVRYGRGHDSRPSLRLAAAVGAEISGTPNAVAAVSRLLTRLGADDAAPDDPRVFLPIAAAYGWVAELRAGRQVGPAWAALAELAGDERSPVRLGALDALVSFAASQGSGASGADQLLGAARDWLELEDREVRFGATAVVIEVFASRQALAALGDPERLLDFLSRAITIVAASSRSEERSDARRRLLLALPRTLAGVVVAFAAGDRGEGWLRAECESARHPDVREALSNALRGVRGAAAPRLRAALESSAKPPRDPTRIRPGLGRGKMSRRVR